MSEENTCTESKEADSAVCCAADALKRAKAELEKAQAFYESVREKAGEQLKAARETRLGDVLDCTLATAKHRPCLCLAVAAALGFFLGRLFRR